jgi:hypothetical protein
MPRPGVKGALNLLLSLQTVIVSRVVVAPCTYVSASGNRLSQTINCQRYAAHRRDSDSCYLIQLSVANNLSFQFVQESRC